MQIKLTEHQLADAVKQMDLSDLALTKREYINEI